eukprot:1539752-Rhodomonas_salina.6
MAFCDASCDGNPHLYTPPPEVARQVALPTIPDVFRTIPSGVSEDYPTQHCRGRQASASVPARGSVQPTHLSGCTFPLRWSGLRKAAMRPGGAKRRA